MLLLFIILVLILSIPAVQTSLGKKLTKRINEDFKTNINIEKVGLQFNGDVELKTIIIRDYKKDTLISIDELNTSILSFKKLYNNKLTFGDIDIIGLLFNLKTYKGEKDTNLDIFVNKFEEDKPKTGSSSFLFSSSDITIVNSEFRLTDENRENEHVFSFNDLNINVTDFLVLGPDVSTRINKLSFKDTRGVVINSLTANFAYTLKNMTFDYLQIKTDNSILKGRLKFEYNREDLKHFVDKVKIEATFDDSSIALDELNMFYNEFGSNETAKFSGTLFGTLNDLTASNIILNTSSRTTVNGTILFKNLFNKEKDNFVMDGNFYELSSSYDDLKALLPNILGKSLPSALDDFGKFTIKGKSIVTSKTIDADITIDTNLGFIITHLEMKEIGNIDNASYKGNISLDDFDLGTFLKNPKVGKVSLNLDVNGKGFTTDLLDTFTTGDIYNLEYNGYSYSGIEISGNVQNMVFNGNLIAFDKNLDLKFDGLIDFSKSINNYDFTADVNHIDLNALNFVSKDSISVFKGQVSMKMKGTNIDNAYGNVTFMNTLYKNQNSEYYFNDFSITSRFEEDVRFIEINSPDIIEGSLSGKFKFKDVSKLIENSLGNIYTNYIPHKITSDQFIDFNFKIYNKIAEVFYRDLKLGNNTFFRGRIESDATKFDLTFKSPQINILNYFASDIQLRINNSNRLFNTYIEADSINTKYYSISKFNLINVTHNDTLFIKTEFKGGKHNTDEFDLNLFYTINEENKSVLGFKKSDVNFKNNLWFVNENKNNLNKIEFDRSFKNIKIDNIRMSHSTEEIDLSGVLKDSTYKNIDLNFKNVDLTKIAPQIDSLALAGNVNGRLNLQQLNGTYIPESKVTIDDFKVNNIDLGSFKANIIGNESLTNYKVNISLKDDVNETLLVIGEIDVAREKSTLNLDFNLNNFNLDPLNPFGEGVITNIRGDVTGKVKVTGSLKRPQINGLLSLDDAGLSIPYLNVNYAFNNNTKISLSQQSFILNNAILTDSEFQTKTLLSGSISHVNFSNCR